MARLRLLTLELVPVAVVATDIFVSLLKFLNNFEIKIDQIFYTRVFCASSCCICKLIMFTSYVNSYYMMRPSQFSARVFFITAVSLSSRLLPLLSTCYPSCDYITGGLVKVIV